MSRSAFRAMISIMMVAVFCCASYGAKKPKNIFCVGDTMLFGSKGSYTYSDSLQLFLDKKYGLNKIAVYNYSFYNMNTFQGFNLISDLLEKQSNTEVVVLMAGEANFYNLAGFTDYLYALGQYAAQEPFINEYDIDSVIKLNTGVASFYNSPKVHSKKASMKYIMSVAYRSVAGSTPKRMWGYVPKVIPSFVVLSEDNLQTHPPAASKYKLAWDFINGGKLNEAEVLLKEMLKENPVNSNIYYALGSLYLMKDGDKNAREALRLFQDGILVNPFDKSNQCYKGLTVIYMSYDGNIVSEALYFARIMKSYLGEAIPDINSITAVNTADYDKKISAINNWIISDIKKIAELCKNKGVKLILADYPFEARVNDLLEDTFKNSSITFLDNSELLKVKGVSHKEICIDAANNIAAAIDKILMKK